jgi:crossover junction endodeoxyribonuclease RuvC
MRIISIDPGYERLGIAVLEKNSQKEELLFSECFKTSAKINHDERLRLIGEEIEKVIKKYKPEVLAVETLFFSKNQKTAIKVSEARGVILYVAAKNSLSVKEFMPNEIKIAITGYGASDKKNIIAMVPKLIKINKEIEYDDEFDAIAVGLTYFAVSKF